MFSCPHCQQGIPLELIKKSRKRKVTFCNVFVTTLAKIMVYCRNNKTNIVPIKGVKLKNSEYARMNDLVRFGLAYKRDDMPNGIYGIPRKRVDDFLKGKWEVAKYYWHDPVTNTNEMSEERILVSEVPRTSEIISWYGEKFSQYSGE